MNAFVGSVEWFAGSLRDALSRHGGWMAWNSALALVPFLLALVVFRSRPRRTARWWFGVALFVLFLPNSAYVTTDIVHLLDDVRSGASDSQVLAVYLPLYTLLIVIGFGAYVWSLDLVWGFLHRAGVRVRYAMTVELGLHLLAAVGIYLGRVLRINSWDVIAAPGTFVDQMDVFLRRFPVAFVAAMFMTLVGGTMFVRMFRDGLVLNAHRLSSLRHGTA
jgi:uncharacterized membrane protein